MAKTERNSLMRLFSSTDTRSELEQKTAFLTSFMNLKSLTQASRESLVSITKVNKWRNFDETFSASFNEILLHKLSELEDSAYKRAVEGVEEPIYQGGELVGTVTKYSDRLTELLLKGNDPKKYRDKLIVDGKKANTNNQVLILPENGREIEAAPDYEEAEEIKETSSDDNFTQMSSECPM